MYKMRLYTVVQIVQHNDCSLFEYRGRDFKLKLGFVLYPVTTAIVNYARNTLVNRVIMVCM